MMQALRQVRLLRRAFFSRLLESELMPAGLPQVQLLVWAIAALSMPAMAVPVMLGPGYPRLANTPAFAPAVAFHRLLLITIGFAVMGLVALAIWDGVFPDRRDARILSPLPIRTPVLVAARLGAIATIFLLFLLGTSLVPTILHCLMAAGFSSQVGFARSVVAQFAAIACAGAFGFFSLLLLQCLLVATLTRSLVQRVSVVLQILFTFFLLQLLLLIPWFSGISKSAGSAPDWIRERLPPIWFFALFERLAGVEAFTRSGMAARALAATVAVVAGTVLLYAASYRSMLRDALESAPVSRRNRSRRRIALPQWLTGRPVERAVAAFTLRTLVRSRQHRLLLAVFVAAGLALAALGVLPSLRSGAMPITRPGAALGHVPFVMLFCVLAGLRWLFAIPAQPRASWALRVSEPEDRVAIVNGARRALIAGGVVPIVIASLLLTGVAWGPTAALRHAVFTAVMGVLLAELSLWGFCKLPFTCTYLPGRSKLRTRWPALFFAFSWYCYALPVLEFGLLRSSMTFLAAIALGLVTCAASAGARAAALRGEQGLLFAESDPDALFEGFKLSERMAAEARSRLPG